MSQARILILADSGLAAALRGGLGGHGFRVEATAALDAALAMAAAIGFDAAVIDYAALGMRPKSALARVRAILGAAICILAPKSLRRPPDGLPLLQKPVRLQALATALRSIIRPPKSSVTVPKRPAGGLQFDAPARKLVNVKTSETTRLTEIETNLLSALARAPGASILREDLLRAVWSYNSTVSTRTLETHIYRLRQKLARATNRAKLLETVPGGYRLALGEKDLRR